MGAQQSTRRLTLDNDDPTNVVKISDAVVDRLRARNQNASSSGTPAPPPPAPAAIPVASPLPPRGGIPVSPAYHPHYMCEPSQTSLQVRQEKEIALQQNDQYWQKRINKLEETHEKINKLMDKEYNAAFEEVRGGYKRDQSVTRKPACQEGKKAVMACYKKYPQEPMRCAEEVQAFAECVDKHRSALVANRG